MASGGLQLNMTKGYSLKSFRLDLRAALQVAGVQGEHVCLIVEDHNLVDPAGKPHADAHPHAHPTRQKAARLSFGICIC